MFAGPLVAGSIACGETQEEHWWNFFLRRSDVDDDGASTIHFASSSGSRIWTCRCSASNQQSRDSSRSEGYSESHRCESLGRPKEFTGREEDFQQWSKKTKTFFAGVIKESEMMLEWAAEQPTEITTTVIDLEFLPTDTNEDRVVKNLEFVLQQMHAAFMVLTSYEANDIVANSRKNPLEARRRLQKRHDPTTGGRKRNLLRTIISPGRCSLLEHQAVIERWESYVSRYEKKIKDKLDDEIKLAGLESLVPEELEKHLILNSNRLRTFEDARLEVMTYVEAKIGLRIRDSKPSETGARGHSDPMDVDAVNSLSSVKGKGSSSPRDGCFKCGGAHFQRDCNARKSTGKQSSGKGKQSKSWSKSEGTGKSKENNGQSKEIQRNQRCKPRC